MRNKDSAKETRGADTSLEQKSLNWFKLEEEEISYMLSRKMSYRASDNIF